MSVAAGKTVEMEIVFKMASGGPGEANGGLARRRAALQGGGIKTEPNPMDCLQVDLGIGFKVFSELGDEYVHASAQEIVILTPDV
jgi:hypothetical protein